MPLPLQKGTIHPHCPFDNQDTQTDKAMAEKRYTSLTTSWWQLEITGMCKSIIEPQKVVPINIETPEDQLEIRSMSSR